MSGSLLAVAVLAVLVLAGLAYCRWGWAGVAGVLGSATAVGLVARRRRSLEEPTVATDLGLPRREAAAEAAELREHAAELQVEADADALALEAAIGDAEATGEWLLDHAERHRGS